jgi:hypothetical protein
MCATDGLSCLSASGNSLNRRANRVVLNADDFLLGGPLITRCSSLRATNEQKAFGILRRFFDANYAISKCRFDPEFAPTSAPIRLTETKGVIFLSFNGTVRLISP